MNENILAKAVQEYIDNNLNKDVNQIALAKSSFLGVSSAAIAGQILAKKKSEKKLPTWFNTKGIYYPPALSIEQTSSEITAAYKAKLGVGTTLIDLTGGFGIDTYYFSKRFKSVTHCEINIDLSEIAAYNAKILQTNNIDFMAVDGMDFMAKTDSRFDTIYIDPARRASKGKVFMLKDCTPDITTTLDLLLEKSKRIIIKTAPLLDITAGLNELNQVSEIHIISTKNECKELLWIIDSGYIGEPEIFAIAINEEEKQFSFNKSEVSSPINFALDTSKFKYLYEPDAALLKSGAFNLIGKRYGLEKLHPQTQLYLSNVVNSEFPGRIFELKEQLSTAQIKKEQNLTGNIIVRNYPAKAEELVKKFKIKPSHNLFLIFTKINNNENIIFKANIIQHY